MARTPQSDMLCTECWNRALDCFGTGKIFRDRAKKLRAKLDAISDLGIAVPALVGGVVLSYGTDGSHLSLLISAAAGLGLVQLMLSIASVVKSWPSELEYANESSSANFELSEHFSRLGRMAQDPPAELSAMVSELRTLDTSRRQQDEKRSVSDVELRKGHRHGLKYFQRKCAQCQLVPASLKSTTCPTCGEFSWTTRFRRSSQGT